MLSNYRSDIRPVINLSTTVNMKIYTTLYTLYDLDFINNLLTARYIIKAVWFDEHLKWNPLDYNNITYIYIPKKKLWNPGLVMCNSMTQSEEKDSLDDVLIYYDGFVRMLSFTLLQTYCQVNAYSYPFDEHKCEIRMCSATYHTDEANVTSFLLNVYSEEENYKWYMSISDQETYSSYVVGTVYLRRKLTVGIIAMLIPTVMMTILTIFVFLLPPESGEKVSLATTIFLSNVLYLVQIDKNTPANSKYPSLLILYLMVLSLVSGIATLGSVVISKLYVNQSSQENKLKLSEESKKKSQRNKVEDISIISMEHPETLMKGGLPSKKKRNFVIDYMRLDAIFLKLIIVALLIISISFTSLLFSPLE
ncbi:neuronal acetylcholine receptor subunit beta-3 [Octopus bimaculoides]|nr:neuronal acetylcholine receptor subunit beta-3 [Octopus bimaculoides]|eukprot:XP_014779524.1 PREDICTED: neuronal acetylcholine receptor subunit beta-3-like [Octopus bimaculoides]